MNINNSSQPAVLTNDNLCPDKNNKPETPELIKVVSPQIQMASEPGQLFPTTPLGAKHQTTAKTRAVRQYPTPQPEPGRSFGFRFVASDDELRSLLQARTRDSGGDVMLITHPDDLFEDNLVQRLHITADSQPVLESGRLFACDTPLTLVLDIRSLTSEELPAFNDLLDPENPCLYDKTRQEKHSLGNQVSLLVLASPEQLTRLGSNDQAPGADFWRRVNRPGISWQFETQSSDKKNPDVRDTALLPEYQGTPAAIGDGDVMTIDCHLHSHWRPLLFGGPGVDHLGRIRHIPGQLEQLRPGQQVILKGADWQDLTFEQSIRQLLRRREYPCNGETRKLAQGIQFYRMPVAEQELGTLFRSLDSNNDTTPARTAGQNHILINPVSMAQWLNPVRIAQQGYAVPNTLLEQQIRAGGAVIVTAPLSTALWFQLLGALQGIREATGITPLLQVAAPQRQPELPGKSGCTRGQALLAALTENRSCAFVLYQQAPQATAWLAAQQEAPLVIQVNEQTTLSQLFDNIHVTSEQQARFGRCQTPLHRALQAGTPVVLRGLASNPELLQALEPLFCAQPLLVNGELYSYPRARITVLWSASDHSPSPLLSAALARATPCPEPDIWAICAGQHGMNRADLPEQAITRLYEALRTVPRSLCEPLPTLTQGLLNSLILAARQAQHRDNASALAPRHWRKGIDSLLTHRTRQTTSVRDFSKVVCRRLLPDADGNHWVDPDRLQGIIASARPMDRAFVKEHWWPLARAFGPALPIPVKKDGPWSLSFDDPLSDSNSQQLDSLCAMLVAQAPQAQQPAMARQLQIDPGDFSSYRYLPVRPSAQIKRLEDALTVGWSLPLKPGQTRSDAIHTLASTCFTMARAAGEGASEAASARISEQLRQSLVWQGSTEAPLRALARDLCHARSHQKDRESRRLARLRARLAEAPVIFLQGETGTGKSYFAATLARACGPARVVSLGPSDTEQTLMQRWQWQQQPDSNDRYMVQQEQALMAWANTPGVEQEYVTLVLDEANLARTGLLAALNGLWEPTPCVYVSGHPVTVSPNHRVILTGNPDHYTGRQLDPTLKALMPAVYYPPLNRAFLRDRVVAPALLTLLQRHLPESRAEALAQQGTDSVMALWQYYPELLPVHGFTPRDLTDICAWVGWYLDQSQPETPGPVTLAQLNGLILQGFRDVLDPAISAIRQDARTALAIWFASQYPVNNTLTELVRDKTLKDINQTFARTAARLKPEFDTSGAAVSNLVHCLGQDLSRCQQANQHQRQHGGRQATLIEGPAGRGKDVTLQLLINSYREQLGAETLPEVRILNACDCTWDILCKAIRQAKIRGEIVVIAELNRIDSQHLEGELNDILAGDAHPGFHLFATINPPHYGGRKALSPALAGRFRYLPIRQYSPAELQAIAGKVLPQTRTAVAASLTWWHCQLRSHLAQHQLPLQPASLDLQRLARAVADGGDFSDRAIKELFSQHYRLYLLAAKTTLEALSDQPVATGYKGTIEPQLCTWLNTTLTDLERPWLIRRGACTLLREDRHEITVNSDLDEPRARQAIITLLARAHWQASGLSPEPDITGNALTQAFYRYWQQQWFNHRFGHTGMAPDTAFPLTAAQQQAMTGTAQQYLPQADQLIDRCGVQPVHLWPALWKELEQLLTHPVRPLSDQVRPQAVLATGNTGNVTEDTQPVGGSGTSSAASNSDNAVEALYQSASSSEAGSSKQSIFSGIVELFTGQRKRKRRDNLLFEFLQASQKKLCLDTDFESQNKPDEVVGRYFIDSKCHPAKYRFRCLDVIVAADGGIVIDDLPPEPVEVTLPNHPTGWENRIPAANQSRAHISLKAVNGLFRLPGLSPHEDIIGMVIQPGLPFRLTRDDYCGLHSVVVPAAKRNETIAFTYLVQQQPDSSHPSFTGDHRVKDWTRRPETSCSAEIKTGIKDLFEHMHKVPEGLCKDLLAIQKAESPRQRIEAIAHYCQQFTGKGKPDPGTHFFSYLLHNRQGACAHRSAIFVALCRYYGIASRLVGNAIHTFPEYSLDDGGNWQSRLGLGGAPARLDVLEPDVQPTQKAAPQSSQSQTTPGLFDQATEQQKRRGSELIVTGKPGKTVDFVSPLPTIDLNIVGQIRALCRQGLTGLLQGDALLEKMDRKISQLGNDKELLPDLRNGERCLYEEKETTLKAILLSSLRNESKKIADGQIINQLMDIKKLFMHCNFDINKWLEILSDAIRLNADFSEPSTINIVREALASGLLDPDTLNYRYKNKIFWGGSGAIQFLSRHRELINYLEGFDELKPLAIDARKKWYTHLFGYEKTGKRNYQEILEALAEPIFITHDHGGNSPSLQSGIAGRSLNDSWTNDPTGIPDIGRMLAHKAAFPMMRAGKNHQRPVIMIGQPKWKLTNLPDMVNAILPRISRDSPEFAVLRKKEATFELDGAQKSKIFYMVDKPDRLATLDGLQFRKIFIGSMPIQSYLELPLKVKVIMHRGYRDWELVHLQISREEKRKLENLEKHCEESIKQAFFQYLFHKTHINGGSLTFCWEGRESKYGYDRIAHDQLRQGARKISSAKELIGMTNVTCPTYVRLSHFDRSSLQQALNISDALVLTSAELTTIAREFCSSVDPDSLAAQLSKELSRNNFDILNSISVHPEC
ncbi:AAA family ATPase [Thalassotalea sp. G20_0]|uniref:AAA family ATPase n=1 Tax=Thalassotalea sp. G20_0 TaxID=2821093 RepID=UPI001ADA7702|nr:AAA family ATPase [Thalassotalea sp. G20_0]MBO9496439.1 AAA family ATPase [Thalassotalea sp. G20_0]